MDFLASCVGICNSHIHKLLAHKVCATSQDQNETKYAKIGPVVTEIFQISNRKNKKNTLLSNFSEIGRIFF